MTYLITSDRDPQGGPSGHPQIGDGRDDGHRDTELDGRDENLRFAANLSVLVSKMVPIVVLCVCAGGGT